MVCESHRPENTEGTGHFIASAVFAGFSEDNRTIWNCLGKIKQIQNPSKIYQPLKYVGCRYCVEINNIPQHNGMGSYLTL